MQKNKPMSFTIPEICVMITGFFAPASLSGDFDLFKGISFVFVGAICSYGLLQLWRKLKEKTE